METIIETFANQKDRFFIEFRRRKSDRSSGNDISFQWQGTWKLQCGFEQLYQVLHRSAYWQLAESNFFVL